MLSRRDLQADTVWIDERLSPEGHKYCRAYAQQNLRTKAEGSLAALFTDQFEHQRILPIAYDLAVGAGARGLSEHRHRPLIARDLS